MRYRVEELAAACDVSVDTVRYYQTKGLLPPPGREGRIAWYSDEHVERIRQIRAWQREGLTLAFIGRLLEGGVSRGRRDIAAAVGEAHLRGEAEAELLTVDELAARSGVPTALIEAIEREGVSVGRRVDGELRYTSADVEIVRIGLRLLDRGVPLSELLVLAGEHHDAMERVALRAVELFDEHVRGPIKERAASEEEAARELVEAFREMLPAVTKLVAHHFRRTLLSCAEEHIERVGDPSEVEATRSERGRLEAI